MEELNGRREMSENSDDSAKSRDACKTVDASMPAEQAGSSVFVGASV